MTNARVSGVRSIELGVRDLARSADFYRQAWGLEDVAAEEGAVYMRATGGEHHVLTLRQQGKASLLGVHFAARDQVTVDRLCAQAKAFGIDVAHDPKPLPGATGGGYGFRFRTPEGMPMSISSDVNRHTDTTLDRSRPSKISHVVLNSGNAESQVKFLIDVLGFKLSDSTHMMEFLRCSCDHHSVAMVRSQGPSLNHVAYEVPNIDGLMLGSGRLRKLGFDIEWGVGRHGPGNNVFSYFIEPDGFVAEYTTEVDQIDEATHVAQGPDYWEAVRSGPDRWGVSDPPSNRMRAAMSGEFYQAEWREGERCEDVIGRRLG